jgi:hypothetical protein
MVASNARLILKFCNKPPGKDAQYGKIAGNRVILSWKGDRHMTDQQENIDPRTLLEGLKLDAEGYFKKAEEDLDGIEVSEWSHSFRHLSDLERLSARDQYWVGLAEEIRSEAKRLYHRLVSLMGQVARTVRNAPLASEADQRDVMAGTKTMRAALLLRRFRSWETEILNDEDVALGVTPAGQSDDEPLSPTEARQVFAGWAEKITAILDLIAASTALGPIGEQEITETVRYRPGTAFIMMWMDKSQPDLIEVSDTVKNVFAQFDIRAARADDIEHEGLITERILTEIKTSEFCFADLSGSRPNVYYEVGFAHALPRRVILVRKAGTGLHFDLAGYNCPEYDNLRDLKEKLTQRLRALTNKEPHN